MVIVKVLSNAGFRGTILPEHRQGSGRAGKSSSHSPLEIRVSQSLASRLTDNLQGEAETIE